MTRASLFSRVAFVIVIVAAVAAYALLERAPSSVGASSTTGQPETSVNHSALSADQSRGRLAFNTMCAECHGRDALGGDGGPPLVHKIYEPSHHADGAFYRAVQAGVQQHHWGFGNMPPQHEVSQAQVADIIDYVRAAQRQNGIN